MTQPLPSTRAQHLQTAAQDTTWDVVVIGGGASGLGAAVEAATRGYKTLLLEAYDYAKGTSSRSTKLVHGGVRYLAQGNVSLVREALHERGLLKKNAPHLVHDLGFLIASYTWWSKPFYGIGMKVYDALAGKLNLQPSRLVSKAKALQMAPTLQKAGIKGGVLYFDGQFDDSRLAITLLRTFEDYGGVALNYTPVVGLTKSGSKISGVSFQDSETGKSYAVKAKTVINATGVFVDSVRKMDDAQAKPMLSPSQGVHVVVARQFWPSDSALMVPRTDDGRVLFAVPWHDHVVIGTTDTAVPEVSLEPRALPEEIDFILKTASQYMSPAPTRADVQSVYVGLRPLVKAAQGSDTKAISRDHVIRISESGLLTLTGGKWTTYRRMGEDAVNRAAKLANLPERLTLTPGLRLHGWSEDERADHWKVYGSDADKIQKLEGATTPLHPKLPYMEAEVRWAAQMEQARTVEDVLSRRLRALLLNAQSSIEAAPRVAELLAEELGHDKAWQAAQVEQYRDLAKGYLLPA
ncbi:glycerol-3-phosphate dehydrogenase/oxidase [Deinococcus psychrotolerans]|uniref:Glycerol-3-phosphate dehydrogenase/oxidase n=1 Tax=Deinococcus psychrotolerans TaxID=2489213 RepID=A0A3G8YDZ3_9DEIO|nr:glycerol-3-phosphate dehydrogenase/oxidase [Deinococcus psychrotolerans]AZI43195.1 glycerol-3-phosphate dehydrogenase/oxidase [Deinococcus psychrotolerans]